MVYHVNPYLNTTKKRICDSIDHISLKPAIPVDQLYFLTAQLAQIHVIKSPYDIFTAVSNDVVILNFFVFFLQYSVQLGILRGE